ncbi:hypothetical protein ARMGADRAFT_1070939 [Armillaria gallica]|uniref:Uncharacterized protein n=1 Tax=Armillaria gallica TaxID=47427 RepID=A0A2H3EAQ4_ARMGA|nr:hypothetical protein ARMGADRAFT_1070939 [Armillaria gallica]
MEIQASTHSSKQRSRNLSDDISSGILGSDGTTHISAGLSELDGNEADDELDNDSLFEDFELTSEILEGLNKIEHDEAVAKARRAKVEAEARTNKLKLLWKASECPQNHK